MPLQYLKKEVRDEVDFLHVDKDQCSLQVDYNTFGIKYAYKVILSLLLGMIKHSQNTQSNRFANIFTISQKKKIWRESIFCMQLNIEVSTSWDYCFWWKGPEMQGSSHVYCYLFDVSQEKQQKIAINLPRPIKQARKSLHQALIQIISPKVLQQSTTILQLKVYISYVVQKLVGHPP